MNTASPSHAAPPGKLVLLICDVLRTEFEILAASRPHVVHIATLEQGLHNTPDLLRVKLQQQVRELEQRFAPDAIALGYGLCCRGTESVAAERCRLVLPRAHDCVTLLLGDRQRYAEYVAAHPGCYWYSPGWNRCHEPPGPVRYETLRQRYVEQFGEDNADYLMEAEQRWFSTYSRATWVDAGLSVTDEALAYTRQCAEWLGWTFDRQQGSTRLMAALLDGQWHERDFLVLGPGEQAQMTADDQIVRAVRLPSGASHEL